MQIVSAIIAMAKAKSRFEAKLDHVDAAMRLHGGKTPVEYNNTKRLTPHPEFQSGVQHASVHEGSIKDNRQT